MLLFVFAALALAAPPVLPSAFNTSFTMVLPGAELSASSNSAFWSYDASQGGQLVWHPACPLGGPLGCAIVFTGGLAKPVVYVVSAGSFVQMQRHPQSCCLFVAGVPILPPTSFSKYAFVTNTTILQVNRGLSLQVQMFFSQNRQCYVDAAGNLARVLDVSTAWDLPVMSSWSVGPQPSSLFAVPQLCAAAKSCF
jgi:hypothetical protein